MYSSTNKSRQKKVLPLIGLLLFLSGFVVFGQDDFYYTRIQEKKISIEQYWEGFNLTQEMVDNANGSPYPTKDFLPGRLYKDTETVSTTIPLRYNAFSDEIEVKPSEKGLAPASIKKDPDIFAKIGNEIYIYAENNRSRNGGGYFKMLKDLPVYDLLKKVDVGFRPAEYAKTSYAKDKPAQFISTTTYFLTDDLGNFYELPKNKSKLLKVMSAKELEVKAFMKKNKIDPSKEDDLIQLVTYFNSLL